MQSSRGLNKQKHRFAFAIPEDIQRPREFAKRWQQVLISELNAFNDKISENYYFFDFFR